MVFRKKKNTIFSNFVYLLSKYQYSKLSKWFIYQMDTSITPGTKLERETSLNQKIKKISYIILLILSNFVFHFCKILKN